MKKYLALLLAAALAAGAAPHCARAQIEPVPEDPAPLPQWGVFSYPQFMAWIAAQPELASVEGSLNAYADLGRIATEVPAIMAKNTPGKLQALRDNAYAPPCPENTHIYASLHPMQENAQPIRITLREASAPSLEHADLGHRIWDALRTDRNSGDSYPATSEILSHIYDGQSENSPIISGASAPDAPRQQDIWATLDAVLSARMGLAATEASTRGLQETARRMFRSRVGYDLDRTLWLAFAYTHSLSGEQVEQPRQAFDSHQFKTTSASSNEFEQIYATTSHLVHPHPNQSYVIEVAKPQEILSFHNSLWQRTSEGWWSPIERRLVQRPDGTLWVEPDNQPMETLDKNRFIVAFVTRKSFLAHSEAVMSSLTMLFLPPGILKILPPLPEGWREKVRADLASWKPDF